MLSNSMDEMAPSLKKMIDYCHEINDLLRLDITYFSEDNLTSIENNNKKKSELLNELNALALSLHNCNLESRPELVDSLSQLKVEITHCFRSMVINNNIVNANLNQLKEIWDKLLAHKEASSNLYDKHGSTSK